MCPRHISDDKMITSFLRKDDSEERQSLTLYNMLRDRKLKISA